MRFKSPPPGDYGRLVQRLAVLLSFTCFYTACCCAKSLTSAPLRSVASKTVSKNPFDVTNHSKETTRLHAARDEKMKHSRVVRGGATTAVLKPNSKKQFLSPAVLIGLKNSLASGLAAGCSKTILQPFDTIKTIQQQSQHQTSAMVGGGAVSIRQAAEMIMKRPGGIWNFYAGLGVSVIGSMPSVGLYFGVYSYSKRTLGPILHRSIPTTTNNNKSNLPKTLTIALSAAIGNTVASFSRVPYEVVKQKLQTGEYTHTFGALSSMMKSPNPLASFFPMGGVSAQMARDIPYAIITLLSYEYLRDHWVQVVEERRGGVVSPWRNMVTGGLAGGIGSYLTNPMDVIKTRLQMQTTDVVKYAGVWDCARLTLEEDSAMAFLRGSVPRLMHKIPANAVFFVAYEMFRQLLRVEDAVATAKDTNAN